MAGLGVWRWQQGAALSLAESSSEIFGGGDEDVSGAGNWHGEVVGKPVDGVGDAEGICGWNPDLVASILVEARANVETSGGMDSKRFSAFSAFMGEDFDAGWCQWGFIEIERAVKLGMGG